MNRSMTAAELSTSRSSTARDSLRGVLLAAISAFAAASCIYSTSTVTRSHEQHSAAVAKQSPAPATLPPVARFI